MILTKQFLNEQKQKGILNESFAHHKPQALNEYDVFISYSWNDRQYAHLVEQLLKKCGYSAYVDFNDLALNRSNVSEDTAKRLVEKMRKCKGLLYISSRSSKASKGVLGKLVFSPVLRNSAVPICRSRKFRAKISRDKSIWIYIHMWSMK